MHCYKDQLRKEIYFFSPEISRSLNNKYRQDLNKYIHSRLTLCPPSYNSFSFHIIQNGILLIFLIFISQNEKDMTSVVQLWQPIFQRPIVKEIKSLQSFYWECNWITSEADRNQVFLYSFLYHQSNCLELFPSGKLLSWKILIMIMGSHDLNHIEAVEFFPFKGY